MNVGMLWLSDRKLTLLQNVQRAFDYYLKKYGRRPDLCLVHPSLLEKDQSCLEVGNLTVRPYRPVLPGHIWIGIEDTGGPQEPA